MSVYCLVVLSSRVIERSSQNNAQRKPEVVIPALNPLTRQEKQVSYGFPQLKLQSTSSLFSFYKAVLHNPEIEYPAKESCNIQTASDVYQKIPEGFHGPISLEFMVDPVFVLTGQDYTTVELHDRYFHLKEVDHMIKLMASLQLQICTPKNMRLLHCLTFPYVRTTNRALYALGTIYVLTKGSMEARKSAAATLFNLSVVDENKVTIGLFGAIPPHVTLLNE
ncbi:hypothetical protein POM88_051647 [Heracleum sosnowskyi]|uniref:Uncharacterized protein n=1 Tax=Heracleum sosnowskyi TaxID=360622 RepID=A0AAD8H2M5_9APIA|nr:hypothetical protein POM88_051647 [Heracleum sosnowskyi]